MPDASARYAKKMNKENETKVELDTRGLLCPLPVLKARKRMQSLKVGDLLYVEADDPAARVDFPHFCTEQGHHLIKAADEPEGVLSFLIRKGDGE